MIQAFIIGASFGMLKNLEEFLTAKKPSWVTVQLFHIDSAISTIKI